MSEEVESLKRKINRSVMIYIIGSLGFVLLALASLWLGYYVIRYHEEHDWPTQLTIFSLGGVWLLGEMVKAFRFKATIPATFKKITEQDAPALFRLINEVTQDLGLSPIRDVYISPDAIAAVFIQPQMRNFLSEPKRDLVMGLGFLTQMDDDEIRAILYHEFGHYVQDEMKNSISVYTIGQFSKSFVAIKELKKLGAIETQMKSQLLFFTYFAIWICNRINSAYSRLAKQMEYDADDVAVKHVGAPLLQRALIHAACVRYNYNVVMWGAQQLKSNDTRVDDIYRALRLVGRYSRPSRQFLSAEVLRRVERLGRLEQEIKVGSDDIRQSAVAWCEPMDQGASRTCSAAQFANWLREGFALYAQHQLLATSVSLEIHLAKRRHKLPLVDVKYKILLDGRIIGSGNFLKGYTLKHRTSPGKHTISAYAPAGLISTPFEFVVEKDRSYRVEMDYKLYFRHGIYDVFGEKIAPI